MIRSQKKEALDKHTVASKYHKPPQGETRIYYFNVLESSLSSHLFSPYGACDDSTNTASIPNHLV